MMKVLITILLVDQAAALFGGGGSWVYPTSDDVPNLPVCASYCAGTLTEQRQDNILCRAGLAGGSSTCTNPPPAYTCDQMRETLAGCANTCTTSEFATFLASALPLYINTAQQASLFTTLKACPQYAALPPGAVAPPPAPTPCAVNPMTGRCQTNGCAVGDWRCEAGIGAGEETPPCFPSDALVTMVDGTPRRLDALRAGDTIVAARADGSLTNDIVSHLSLADADVKGTSFVVLTTESGRNLTLTPTHHVPVGATCCANLKEAKDIVVGETVYEAVVSAAVRATQVKKIGTVTKSGLHSPVLSHGAMPIMNGVVTSFDTMEIVRLATYGLPLLEATGLTTTFRDAVLAQRKYIRSHDGYIA